jgi:hypothetical protein
MNRNSIQASEYRTVHGVLSNNPGFQDPSFRNKGSF